MSEFTPVQTPSDPSNSTQPIPPALTTVEQATEKLSIPQRDALSALIGGQPVPAAAQKAGVHRTTVSRWMRYDPVFRAVYNAWQQEVRESSRVKLLTIAQEALTTVMHAIQGGDQRLAYRLLKDLGMLNEFQDGLIDPELIRQQIEIERTQQTFDLAAQAQQLKIQFSPPA